MKIKITAYVKKHYPLMLSFCIPVILMLGYFIYRKMAPFGQNTLLTVDLGQQYIDFFAFFRNSILHDPSNFFYSFNKAIGGEMFGEFAYYLLSPFNLLFLFFPGKSITAGVMLVTLLKYGCSGYTFGRLLKKQQIQSNILLPLFSTVYALMGWAIANQLNLLWVDALVFLPLIINSLLQLLKNQHGTSYSLWLALMFISNYYMGYMIALFLILFFIWTETDNFVSIRHTIKDSFLFISRSLLSAGLACLVLLPTLFSLQSSKGEYTTNVIHAKIEYPPLQMLSKLLVGSFNFKQMSTGLPNIFVGSLVLFGFLLYFLNRKFKWQTRLCSFLITAFLFLSMCFEPLDLLWHGMQFPVWYPYRFSFLVSFWMIYLAALNYQSSLDISAAKVLALALLYAGIIFLSWRNMKKLSFMSKETLICSILFATATLTLLLIRSGTVQSNRINKIFLLFLVVGGETFTNAILSLNNISYLNQKEYAYPSEALANDSKTLSKIDSGFYRTGQTYSRTKNDGIAHDLNTGSYFSSALEKSIPDFYGQLGDPDGDNYVTYSNGSLISDSLLGMKYFTAPKDSSELDQKNAQKKALTPLTVKPEIQRYQLVKNQQLTKIYKNPLAATVGYSANEALKNVKLPINDPVNYQTNWLNAATGTWPTTKYFTAQNFNEVVFQNADKTVNLTGSLLKKKNKKDPAQVIFKFTPKTNDPYYLTFGPGMEETNVETYTGSHSLYHYGTFRHTVILNIADHSKNNEVTITTRFKKDSLFLENFVLYRLDSQQANKKLQQIKKQSWHVKEINNRHLSGKINIKNNNQIFATTIPYSSGWTVKIDGKKVPTFKLQNTFIGANISKGQHTVTMKFTPPYFYQGLLISLLSILILTVVEWRSKKQQNM